MNFSYCVIWINFYKSGHNLWSTLYAANYRTIWTLITYSLIANLDSDPTTHVNHNYSSLLMILPKLSSIDSRLMLAF